MLYLRGKAIAFMLANRCVAANLSRQLRQHILHNCGDLHHVLRQISFDLGVRGGSPVTNSRHRMTDP